MLFSRLVTADLANSSAILYSHVLLQREAEIARHLGLGLDLGQSRKRDPFHKGYKVTLERVFLH